MGLPPRTLMGPYELVSPLGAGGMGQVYRAHDTRLGRDVALKVLPPEFATDATRRARFETEARAVAALNHPNIVAIYDVGENYLVTELVDGHGLKPAPLESFSLQKTIDMASQIAEGLAAAHAAGITHRDLKPDNVMVTREGRVKILDFGLAKRETLPEDGDTLTLPQTQPGTVMGTVGYMSPEQVRGQKADHRSDIFSFGVILYELLAGRRAFQRESAPETMAAIVRDEPPELPDTAPSMLKRIVGRCLEKEPARRFQSASDLAFALQSVAQSSAPVGIPAAPLPVRRRLAAAAAGLLLLCAAALMGRFTGRAPQANTWSGTLLGGSLAAFSPRISPDGQWLAFQVLVDGQNQLAVMKPSSGEWTVLTRDRSRGAMGEMSWSPDGAKIYFDRFGSKEIFSIPALGGQPRLVLQNALGPQSLPDGSLLVSRGNSERIWQLHRFWPETGRQESLPAIPSQSVLVPPVRVFPDGREAVFFGKPAGEASGSPEHLHAIDLESGKTRQLAPGVFIPVHHDLLPLAVHPDGRTVLVNLPAGDLHRIVAVPRDGSGNFLALLTLTMVPGLIDMSADGVLYVDQWDRPIEVLRFPASGGTPQRIVSSPGFPVTWRNSLHPLTNGQILFPSRIAGRVRLMLAGPDRAPVPLLAGEEETAPPAVPLNSREVALMAGPDSSRGLAIASLAEGRIVRRLQGAKGAVITSLAASPDGNILYYVAAGAVWAIPATDGEPRKLRGGDAVAVDLKGNLIIQLNEPEDVRLVKVTAAAEAEQAIPVPAGIRLHRFSLSSGSGGKEGSILLGVGSEQFWSWRVAMLDPSRQRTQPIPVLYEGDISQPSWTAGGDILALGTPLRVHIWRFRPEEGRP